MRKTYRGRCGTFAMIATIVLAGLAGGRAAAGDEAGILITGGPIYTAEDANPKVEAVLIIGKRIVFAGARAEAEKRMRGLKEITYIDLPDGAAAYPGFTDSHAHLFGIGLREMTLNLEGATSLADMLARIRAAAAAGGRGTL